MMVEQADTTDFKWSRKTGNHFRDALKVGELFAPFGMTTPSQALMGRCRDWMGAAYIAASDRVKAQSGPQTDAVAKAIVVRKSVAREGVRVRLPVIPKTSA